MVLLDVCAAGSSTAAAAAAAENKASVGVTEPAAGAFSGPMPEVRDESLRGSVISGHTGIPPKHCGTGNSAATAVAKQRHPSSSSQLLHSRRRVCRVARLVTGGEQVASEDTGADEIGASIMKEIGSGTAASTARSSPEAACGRGIAATTDEVTGKSASIVGGQRQQRSLVSQLLQPRRRVCRGCAATFGILGIA